LSDQNLLKNKSYALFKEENKKKKEYVGVTDQMSTITSFKKLVLAAFWLILRYACVWRSRTRPQERQGEFL